MIEQIRKLRARLTAISTQSERHTSDAEMLYSVHVYARNFHYADLALERGRDAHRAARSIGYRWLEFVAAGGVALTHLELGEPDEAEEWLDRARSAAMVTPSPLRARQLELWRGMARAEAGDVDDALRRLGRALELAREQRSRPGMTEAVTAMALVAALLGSDARDEELLGRAARWAEDALALSQQLPGQHPWQTRALAATAQLRLAGGDAAAAADTALEAVKVMDLRFLEPVLLDVLLIAARSAAAGEHPQWPALGERIRWDLHEISSRILDEDVRSRWLEAPLQRELRGLAGEPEASAAGTSGRVARVLSEHEREILRRVARGMTNREIAGELQLDARAVGKDLANVFSKLGVRSRAAATTVALREGVA